MQALGVITEVLGEKMGTSIAVDIALRKHEIPFTWPAQVERQVADIREEVPESAKKAVLICAICRWSLSTAKMPVTLMMRYTAKPNAAAAGVCGWRLLTSVIMCVRRRHWMMKPAAGNLGLLPVTGRTDAAGSAVEWCLFTEPAG